MRGPPQPALPVAPQLSLGWSWGAGERSHKWFLLAAEEFRPWSEAVGGRAGCQGRQEKEAGLPGVGAPGSPCRCGGEGSGASWCRWQARREAVLVSLSPATFASARVGVPRFSPVDSPLQQLSGTAPRRAAQYGIRLTPAGATEPRAALSPPG